MERYEVLTPPTAVVLSLDTVKGYCKIDTTASDLELQVMIDSVMSQCERITNHILRPTGFRAHFEDIQVDDYACRYPYVDLLRAPILSDSDITSVQIWDGTNYTDESHLIQVTESFPRILFNEYAQDVSRSYSYQNDVAYPLRIDFTAGYAEGQVPQDLLNAMYAHVLFLYENRGDVEAIGKEQLPAISERVYRNYRLIGTF